MTDTITKGLIGKNDVSLFTGGTTTFSRKTSTGGTHTLNRFDWMGIDVYQSYGKTYGKTSSSIDAAIKNSSDDAQLFLSPGTWVISDDLEIPDGYSVAMPMGAVLSIATGKVVTIQSPGNIIATKNQQIFSGLGTVVFDKPGRVYAEWWGAVGDGSTDDYASFRSAYTSVLSSGGGIIEMLGKRYKIDTTINIGLASDLSCPVVWQGVSGSAEPTPSGTVLDCSAITSGNGLFEQNQGDYVFNHNFRDFTIAGAAAGEESPGNADGFRLAYLTDSHFECVNIILCAHGINVVDQDLDRVSFSKMRFHYNGIDVNFANGGGTYQNSFSDINFMRTQTGSSIYFDTGCVVKHTSFKNCSWVSCENEAVKTHASAYLGQTTFDTCYSEQNCNTSGDYAFDFNDNSLNLKFINCAFGETLPAEATMRIALARSIVLIGNNLGYENTCRSIDFGSGSGDVYNPILIGNTFYADSGGDYITLLGTSTMRNAVAISNIPNDLGIETVFSVADYYGDSKQGIRTNRQYELQTLTANATFTYAISEIVHIDPSTGHFNFNPTGDFKAGHKITVTNIDDTYNVIFDSTACNQTIAPANSATFYYDGSLWRRMHSGSIAAV